MNVALPLPESSVVLEERLVSRVPAGSPDTPQPPGASGRGIPELWCHHSGSLDFHRLDATGKYIESDESLALPGLRPAALCALLARRNPMDDTRLVLEFREWIRRRFGAD